MKTFFIFTTMAAGVWSQSQPKDGPLVQERLQGPVRKIAQAGGDRFVKTGKERWSATAEIRPSATSAPVAIVQILMEWPGRVLMDGPGFKGVFQTDKPAPPGRTGVYDDLANALLDDSLDGFMAGHGGRARFRLVGTGYPDPDRPGQSNDVYSVIYPAVRRSASDQKLYYFDHQTGLLQRVTTAAPASDLTILGWQSVSGNQFPTVMVRRVNGIVTSHITLRAPSLGARAQDGIFGQD